MKSIRPGAPCAASTLRVMFAKSKSSFTCEWGRYRSAVVCTPACASRQRCPCLLAASFAAALAAALAAAASAASASAAAASASPPSPCQRREICRPAASSDATSEAAAAAAALAGASAPAVPPEVGVGSDDTSDARAAMYPVISSDEPMRPPVRLERTSARGGLEGAVGSSAHAVPGARASRAARLRSAANCVRPSDPHRSESNASKSSFARSRAESPSCSSAYSSIIDEDSLTSSAS